MQGEADARAVQLTRQAPTASAVAAPAAAGALKSAAEGPATAASKQWHATLPAAARAGASSPGEPEREKSGQRGKWKAFCLGNKVFIQMSKAKRLFTGKDHISIPSELYKQCFPVPEPERGAMTVRVMVPQDAVGSGEKGGAIGGGVEQQEAAMQQPQPMLQRLPSHQQQDGISPGGGRQGPEFKSESGHMQQQQEHSQQEHQWQGSEQQQLSLEQKHQQEEEEDGESKEGMLLQRLTQVSPMVEVLSVELGLTCRNSMTSNIGPIARPVLKGCRDSLRSYDGWRVFMFEAVGVAGYFATGSLP